MGLCGRHLLVRLLLLALALITVLGLSASQATAKRQATCTWGASSIHIEIVGGRVISSPATTSGCIPR